MVWYRVCVYDYGNGTVWIWVVGRVVWLIWVCMYGMVWYGMVRSIWVCVYD